MTLWRGRAMLIGFLLPLALAGEPVTAEEAWRDASMLASRAHDEFVTLLRRQENIPGEIALGDALTLLTMQPATVEHREEARRKLQDLSAGEDDAAQAAKYFLARMLQSDAPQPHFAEAAALYRELIARHGRDYWGQLAVGKLAILQLYALPVAAPAERLSVTTALLPQASSPVARDLHLMLADAGLYYRQGEPAALQHLLAAEALDRGALRLGASRRADLLVQIADLSAQLGELAQAQRYARMLRDEFPQDWRLYPLQQLIQSAVEGKPSALQ